MTTTETTRQKVSQVKTVLQHNQAVKVQAAVGAALELDSGRCEQLLEGDDNVCPGWDGCDFRFPNPVRGWEVKHAIACNVHVTGRTVQRRHGSDWVRVRVEWVQDCEDNTFGSGWLLVNEKSVVEWL